MRSSLDPTLSLATLDSAEGRETAISRGGSLETHSHLRRRDFQRLIRADDPGNHAN